MSLYENETQDKILSRMLARVPAKFDKREGSIIYDSTAPASVEFQNAYISIDAAIDETFADTASRENLKRRCAERGLKPKPASYAIVTGSFKPTTIDLPIGTRFSHEDFNYAITKRLGNGLYYLQCETLGSEPNGVTGQLIPIDYIDGLQSAQITEVSILGEDEEETETLRARYFASMQAEAFGGNELDYKNKILSIQGVGGVKLYRASQWNGGGTVKVVIIDSNYGVPTFTLVDQVQTEIDPVINQGEGVGIAPIGHFVSVIGAYNTVINLETVLTYDEGYTWSSCKAKVEAVVDEYFSELNKKWADFSQITVRLAQLESRILSVEGIIDIKSTKINGKEENLAVDKDSLVSRGTINGQ
ncbi:MAG: baseplate J/gp47 family protein [Alphaproteobacteria bacterium]|nr:baseplate J/gp47 family protein [Alphaproteobacteria bacterium]